MRSLMALALLLAAASLALGHVDLAMEDFIAARAASHPGLADLAKALLERIQ